MFFIVLGLVSIFYLISTFTLPQVRDPNQPISPREETLPSSFNPKEKQVVPSPVLSLAETLSSEGEIRIGGASITQVQVDSAYQELPDEVKESTTKSDVVDALVAEQLLVQMAGKKGITVSDAEISLFVDQVKKKAGMDDAKFSETVKVQGLTMAEYLGKVKDMLLISKFLEDELHLRDVKVSDADVNEFMAKNRDQFAEFYDEGNDELISLLKSRVQQTLVEDKRQELVQEYIAGLTAQVN